MILNMYPAKNKRAVEVDRLLYSRMLVTAVVGPKRSPALFCRQKNASARALNDCQSSTVDPAQQAAPNSKIMSAFY